MATKTRRTKAENGKKRKVATPWGAAVVTDEVRVPQRSGDRRFATVVELLESEAGEPLLRIAYTTDGTARRGPVTLRGRDLERLRTALAERPAIAGAFGLKGGGA
jgi:hypothetical protein